ncbi:hypothetical protein [Mucilaginibacter sp. L3T2-6]|uniref:hypothetical protein n=1 Tax=Mucilaginibacter sp. L3T2-6 TaxID=3062491 RepID=UPI0026748380|nr:hypothetical protein [Mucilaginibacter sp. L3T2-6]MDO3643837.1 hypothetical protein [Mucilaginibacter sp. L3T2-6]MDV6216288.1 hypothetical protein [Mucilaginibacter sp. L3T2-6]
MTTTKTEIIISIGQYISHLNEFKTNGIPSNSIVHKEITGCGITRFEIECQLHNSIIILPNVPVIKDKVKKHNKDNPNNLILGVHKGVDVSDIKLYLINKKAPVKKILTTPEGFIFKVLKAFKDDLTTLRSHYFLLYDECERIVTDISYRGTIAAPIDELLKFTNKALVSATTTPFSDERLANFNQIIIKPDYEYSKSLRLISTNNVVSSLKKCINELQSKRIFIFYNSTNGIAAMAKTLDIVNESKAFCSTDSVYNLKVNGYPNADSELDVNDLAKYNFLTSRYYSAFDIKLEEKPDVIILTDIYYAGHSIVDPAIDVIQIAGRFRNGLNSLTHISNYKSTLEVKTPEEALMYLEGCLDTYDFIAHEMTKSKNQGAVNSLKWFLKESPHASFYVDGKRNTFMIDNDLHQEKVLNYYVSGDKLHGAYEAIPKHFTVERIEEEYLVGDGDFHTLNKLDDAESRNQEAARLLDRYINKPGQFKFFLFDNGDERKLLSNKYPYAAKAVQLWGYENLKEIGFTTTQLKKAIKKAREVNELHRLSDYIYKVIPENVTWPESEVAGKIEQCYTEAKTHFKVYASEIKKYFLSRRTTDGGTNAYVIKHRLNPQPIQIK